MDSRGDAWSQLLFRVFKEYLHVSRIFWEALERLAKTTSREWGQEARNAFELQRILRDRQALRFGYLHARGLLADPKLSLNDVTIRLDAGWDCG